MTTNTTAAADAAQRYATAHATHYTSKDLRQALDLYQTVIACHPDSTEAGYSRTQIQNIVSTVVPKAETLASGVAMAVTVLEDGAAPSLPLAPPDPEALG